MTGTGRSGPWRRTGHPGIEGGSPRMSVCRAPSRSDTIRRHNNVTPEEVATMTLGYEGNLYILAFDHRGSFQKKMLGIEGQPSAQDAERISDAKAVIFEGFLRGLDEGAPRDSAGMLVDE